MAENKKKTVEEVLSEYAAASEENAAYVEAGRIQKNNFTDNTESSNYETNAAAQSLTKQYNDAQSRPSMRDAHNMREAEIKQDLRDAGLGFIEVSIESLPTKGLFYPIGTRLHVRAASGAEIRHWSMVDENSLQAINDAIDYIIERCARISVPTGTISWKDLKEIDKFYIILSIRDFTFPEGNNDLTIKVTENHQIKVHKDHIQYIKLGDKIMKYYNEDKRCFTFPVKDPRVKTINMYLPSTGVTHWLREYAQKKADNQQKIDMDFLSIAPLLIADYRKLNEHTYLELIQQSMNWGNYEWSVISKVKRVIEAGVQPKLIYTDEGGGEAETPLTFHGGIKAIFNINLDDELDI